MVHTKQVHFLQFCYVELLHLSSKIDYQDRVVTVDDAIASGLLDGEKGTITRPKMTLDKAYLKRTIFNLNAPLSLPNALNSNHFDPTSKRYTFDNQSLNLSEAIQRNKIEGNELVLYEPSLQKLSTLNEAITAGFLDPIESTIVDPITNKEVGLFDAMDQGLILKTRSDISLQDAVFDGLYDPATASFASVTTVEKLPLEAAINRNIIDIKSTVVSIDNVTLDFEQAVEQGFINTENSTVKNRFGEEINLIEAFDRGILNTISKPVRLHEAIIKNLHDETCGRFIDPETRKKLTVKEAIQESLIDPNSIQIRDPSSMTYLPISINFAIQTGLIDGEKGLVNYNNKLYTLTDAFNLGILIDNKGPISIQRAMHQGIFEENLGRICDPFTDKKISVHEAMRKFVVNPQLPCHFDEDNEKLLSLNETCKQKIINRFQGDFIVPHSDEKLSLPEAMKLGYIIDIESGYFTLYKILLFRLYNIQQGKFIHPVTNRLLSLNQAIEQELIDPTTSPVKNRSGKYIPLRDAIKSGLVDGQNNLYWISDTKSITFIEAMEKGLIVSNEKSIPLERAIRMRLYRPETGKFADPSTNTFQDLKTCIDSGLIDGDTTHFKNFATKQNKPLLQAINDGDLNVAKGRVFDPKSNLSYNFDVAFEKGLLVSVPKEYHQKSEVYENIPSIQIDLVESGKPREMTIEDAFKSGIINPETALIKDPETGKFIILRHYIERYHLILTQKTVIDRKSSFFVFGPQCVIYNREPKSFDEIIETNQLNLATGKVVDPEDGTKECTIKEAVEMGLLDPDTSDGRVIFFLPWQRQTSE